MTPFTESMRYEYPDLTPECVVLDCGGYEGNFAKPIWQKYHCKIYSYEPIYKFAMEMRRVFPPEIIVVPRGVGAYARKARMGVQNDSSGLFAVGITDEIVEIESLPVIVTRFEEVALLKLNVEGAEFEILEALLDGGLMPKIRNLQVQFHSHVSGAVERHGEIVKGLEKTHHCVYDEPWCWEGWKRNL